MAVIAQTHEVGESVRRAIVLDAEQSERANVVNIQRPPEFAFRATAESTCISVSMPRRGRTADVVGSGAMNAEWWARPATGRLLPGEKDIIRFWLETTDFGRRGAIVMAASILLGRERAEHLRMVAFRAQRLGVR